MKRENDVKEIEYKQVMVQFKTSRFNGLSAGDIKSLVKICS